METQNEQKAKQIAENQFSWYSEFDDINSYEECYESALEAMQWKDEQHQAEKQQWIEKAIKLMQHWILEHDYVDIMELEDYVKQKMEE